MRGAAPLIALAALAACEEKQPLFTAECNDGSRIAGAKAVVESRCGRLRGVKNMTPLGDATEPSARP